MFSLQQWQSQGQFTQISGHQIFTKTAGDITKPALLLIHGFPSASWDWEGMWQTLSEHYFVITLDMLGFGLRNDFRGELFIGSQYLLAWADKLVELKTVCHCGRKANHVLRTDENGEAIADGNQVEIGGNDRYVSVCRKHYKAALNMGRQSI